MTAVAITGATYSWGVWVLTRYYGLDIGVFDIALTQAWVTFLIGYAVTEHRQWMA
jgi:hypothetical protein